MAPVGRDPRHRHRRRHRHAHHHHPPAQPPARPLAPVALSPVRDRARVHDRGHRARRGPGMVFVKAGKIATYHHSNPGSDFFYDAGGQVPAGQPHDGRCFRTDQVSRRAACSCSSSATTSTGCGVAPPPRSRTSSSSARPTVGRTRPAEAHDLGWARPHDGDRRPSTNDAFGAGKIEDFSWKALLDFTTCTEWPLPEPVPGMEHRQAAEPQDPPCAARPRLRRPRTCWPAVAPTWAARKSVSSTPTATS